MAAINLKEHYPTTYTEDFLVEVSEEIHQLLADLKRQEMRCSGRSADTMRIIRWMTRIFL